MADDTNDQQPQAPAVNDVAPPTPPPASVTQPTPVQPQQGQPDKPALWRSILQGALTGLAGSAGSTSFGGGLAKGAGAELESEGAKAQAAKSQQQIDQQSADAHNQALANTAHTYTMVAEAQQRMHLLPPDRQTAAIEARADMSEKLRTSGAEVPAGAASDDWHEAQNTVTNLIQKNPGRLFIAEPVKGTDGKIVYQPMEAQDSLITKDITIKNAQGQDVTIPAGRVTGKDLAKITVDQLNQQLKAPTGQNKAPTTRVFNEEGKNVVKQWNPDKKQWETQGNAPVPASQVPSTEWKPKVTADEKKKAELAENMAHNAEGIAAIIKRRPDILGAIGGRFTNVEQMVGNNDPDIAAVGNMVHNYAMANSGIHGFRSQEGVRDTEKQVLNNFKNGPRAVGAGLMAGVTSGQTFIDNARPESYKTHSKQGGVLKGIAQ